MKRCTILFSIFILILTGSLLMAVDHVAVTLKVKGEVNLIRNENTYDLEKGAMLFNGDRTESGDESFAALQFTDNNSIVKLFPNSVLLINATQDGNKLNKKCLLNLGELWVRVSPDKGEFEIETSSTVVSVKGTEFLLTQDESGLTEVFTFTGEVTLQNRTDGYVATLGPGEQGRTMGSGPIQVVPFSSSDIPAEIRGFMEEELPVPQPESLPPGASSDEPTGAAAPPPKTTGPSRYQQDDTREGFSMGGAAGTMAVNGKLYTRISFMPELVLGKFGIGLDIQLLLDSEGKIREEDWDDWQDYLNKIYYIRYGHRGDPFFAKIGGFRDYTLGHGLVMRDYTNMLRYPDERQIGLQLGGSLPYADMNLELFSANLLENEILAGRMTVVPLNQTGIPLFKKLILGGTVAHDRNQFKGLMDTDDDNYPNVFDDYPYDSDWHNEVDYEIEDYRSLYFELFPNDTEDDFLEWFYNSETLNSLRNPSFKDLGKDDITVFGIDYELPLYQSKLLYLSHYAEMAQILDHKNGFIFPGFYSKFLIFHLNLEYRFYQDDFLPGYFGQLYDEERAIAYATAEGDTVITKEMRLAYTTASRGWYASLTTNILNFLFITVAYEDMYGEDNVNNRSLWGEATIRQTIIPNLTTARARYSQTGFDKLEYLKTPSAIIEGTLGYAIGNNTQLIGTYQERYADLDGNGRIAGKDETITTTSFGVEFRF